MRVVSSPFMCRASGPSLCTLPKGVRENVGDTLAQVRGQLCNRHKRNVDVSCEFTL